MRRLVIGVVSFCCWLIVGGCVFDPPVYYVKYRVEVPAGIVAPDVVLDRQWSGDPHPPRGVTAIEFTVGREKWRIDLPAGGVLKTCSVCYWRDGTLVSRSGPEMEELQQK